jgi:hypothetical protein
MVRTRRCDEKSCYRTCSGFLLLFVAVVECRPWMLGEEFASFLEMDRKSLACD